MFTQGIITHFEYYSELGQLSHRSTKFFLRGFYNAMHLVEISIRPNCIYDWKPWRCKRSSSL